LDEFKKNRLIQPHAALDLSQLLCKREDYFLPLKPINSRLISKDKSLDLIEF